MCFVVFYHQNGVDQSSLSIMRTSIDFLENQEPQVKLCYNGRVTFLEEVNRSELFITSPSDHSMLPDTDNLQTAPAVTA